MAKDGELRKRTRRGWLAAPPRRIPYAVLGPHETRPREAGRFGGVRPFALKSCAQ